jgi:hypothetical protein
MNRVGTAHDFILSTDAVNVGIKKTLRVTQQTGRRPTSAGRAKVLSRKRQIRQD